MFCKSFILIGANPWMTLLNLVDSSANLEILANLVEEAFNID